MSWGNSDNTTNNQDMESPAGFHLYATENSSTDPAIKGHNNNASGVAIHSDGKFQVDGASDLNGKLDVSYDSTSEAAARISNTNVQQNAFALDVDGKARVTKDAAVTALEVNNSSTASAAYALHATGKVLADYEGDGDAVKISHSDPTELALNVDGMARIRKTTASAYSILEVINDGEGGSIHADGKFQVDGDSDLNGNLEVDGNSTLNGTLQVTGNSDLNGNLDVSGMLSTNTIEPSSGTLVEVANVVSGCVNLGNGQMANSIVKTLCPLHCNGFIDTISAIPLRVGQSQQNNANSIELGRSGIMTRVVGTFRVDQAATFYGSATFNDPATFNDAATFGSTTTLNGATDINNTVDLDANTTGVAMDVNNANTDPTATAIKASGPVALDARGHVAIDSGKILSLDGTSRQNYIKYNSAESRIEFYIGGNLVFIVDSTGGHNP